jgi:hypothetical protein
LLCNRTFDKNYSQHNIVIPENINLLSRYENAGIMLGKLERISIQISIKDYFNSLDGYERVRNSLRFADFIEKSALMVDTLL